MKPRTILARCALAVALALSDAGAQALTPAPCAQTLHTEPVPLTLHTIGPADNACVTGDTLALTAPQGTDLYANFDGSDVKENAPRAWFTPAGDFILSARVAAGFGKKYDGGALVVYADRTHWAKLLFEKNSQTGAGNVTSTVAKGAGDDAQHGDVAGDAVYLKIARLKDMVVFYSSADGRTWTMIRTFGFPSTLPLQVGFSAQAPESERYTARFSEIRYRPVAFKNYWQGE